MADYCKYLGISFKKGGRDTTGLDCYGLAIQVCKDFGIDLPDYDTPDEQSLIYQLVNSEKELFEELDKPEAGCLVLFSLKPFHFHIGVVVDNNRFIHILEKRNVAIEKLDNWFWKNKIVGFYKWKK